MRASARGVTLGLALAAILIGAAVGLLPRSSPVHGEGIVCSSFGGGPPYAFQTYEATRDRIPYLDAQRLAAQNQLLPADSSLRFEDIQVGAANQRQPDANAAIPTALLHAIGWIESRLNQASIEVAYEATGAVLLSTSCAYGMMQVASFFSNDGDVPSQSESLAGTHYAYNVAAGAQILVDKWNADFFPTIGTSNPRAIESWYYATWAYNGWAASNHPAGAEVDPFRQLPYACDGPFNGYAYQELVLGCTVNPPMVDGVQLWAAHPTALPDLATLSAPGGPLNPEAFFDGWTTVFSAPFSGEDASQPFAAMNMALPVSVALVSGVRIDAAFAASERGKIFGTPSLQVDVTAIELRATDDEIESGTITIRNTGEGLLVFRLVPDVDWLIFDIPAGVAPGTNVALKDGQPSAVTVRIDPFGDGLAEGLHQGTIMVEALLPDGSVETTVVVVLVDKQGVPRYRAGTPQS